MGGNERGVFDTTLHIRFVGSCKGLRGEMNFKGLPTLVTVAMHIKFLFYPKHALVPALRAAVSDAHKIHSISYKKKFDNDYRDPTEKYLDTSTLSSGSSDWILGGYTWDTDPSTLEAQTLVYLICVNTNRNHTLVLFNN